VRIERADAYARLGHQFAQRAPEPAEADDPDGADRSFHEGLPWRQRQSSGISPAGASLATPGSKRATACTRLACAAVTQSEC